MSRSGWVSSSLPYVQPRGAQQGDAWAAETAQRGRRGTQRVVSAEESRPPEEIASLLELPPDDPAAVVRRRIMYLDDEPVELTDTYYPAHLARGTRLAGTAKIPGGAVTLLAELGHVGVLVREDVTARLPSAEEQEALRVGAGEPLLQLTRQTLDAEGRPVQVDRMAMPPQRQRLRYELRIG